MEQQLNFLPLLLVLLLAFIVPLALRRWRWMPVVVGEILAGIIVGRTGFNWIRPDYTLGFLAEIGLALLMFLSGLEINFTLLRRGAGGEKRRVGPTPVAVVGFLMTLGLAWLLSRFLWQKGLVQDPWMIALIFSTTSLGIVVPVLSERGMSAGLFGQTVILAALIADFVTMFLITVYVAVKSHGLTLDILVVGVLFVAALAAYRLGVIGTRRASLGRVLSELSMVPSQIKVHAAMALLLAFVVLAKFLGTEMILGAFLAGAVLSLLSGPGDEQTRRQLEAIGFGFFVPIFFISVGIQFDFPALLRNPTTWLLTPLFLGAAVLLKLVPTLLWRLSFSWRETLAAGALLSARLSLIIAASDIGLRLGVLDEPTHAGFILIAAVTSTLSPLLFNRLLPGPGQRGESLIAILGTGDLASQVTRELELNGETVRFLSYVAADREFEASPADSPGGQTGPVTAPAEPVNFTAFKSLLVLGSDDERNKEICREAIRRGLKHVVAFVHDPVNLAEFQDMGVQPFSAVLYRAPLLALMARNPALFSLLTSARVEHRVREIRLGNRRAAGRLLRRLDLGSDILVLAVRRNAEMIIPHGNSRLELGDYLTVLGHEDALQKLADRLEGKGS